MNKEKAEEIKERIADFLLFISGANKGELPDTPENRFRLFKNLESVIPKTVEARLAALREDYDHGAREALFMAIQICACRDLPIPEWAAMAFTEGWTRYCNAIPGPADFPGQSTLGGAFGIIRPAHFKPSAARRKPLAHLVRLYVDAYRAEGHPIDSGLFEMIADRLPADGGARRFQRFFGVKLPDKERKRLSGKTVERLYYKSLRGLDKT
jgi:hypothetical protein